MATTATWPRNSVPSSAEPVLSQARSWACESRNKPGSPPGTQNQEGTPIHPEEAS